jgi:uncharacterized glyoxalase superfamily protein PhnB
LHHEGTKTAIRFGLMRHEDRDPTMQLTTYLLFDGDCRSAMEFYHSIFGGELTLTTVGESPMKDAFPVPLHSKVVNARLKSRFADISASDWLRPTGMLVKGNNISIYHQRRNSWRYDHAFSETFRKSRSHRCPY